MRKSIIPVIAVSILTIGQCVYAEPISDPIRHFLATPDVDRELAVPNPKTIKKIVLDINGDGREIIFLSGYGDRASGSYWTAYIPTSGSYKAIRETKNEGLLIGFDTKHLYVGFIDEIQKHGLVTYRRGSTWAGALDAYWISGDEIYVKEIGIVKFTDDQKSPPLWKKYFPNAGKADAPVLYPVEKLSVDELKSKGYIIHAPATK